MKLTKKDIKEMKKRTKQLRVNEKNFTVERIARTPLDKINALNFQNDVSLGWIIKQVCMEISELKKGR